MKFRVRFSNYEYMAWYLLPTIRFGRHSDGGGFVALTFMKMDVCLSWSAA